MDSLRDAIEAICRYSDPDKLELRKDKFGMWKVGIALHVTAADAHHVMTVMEEMEQGTFIPNMASSHG